MGNHPDCRKDDEILAEGLHLLVDEFCMAVVGGNLNMAYELWSRRWEAFLLHKGSWGEHQSRRQWRAEDRE